MDSTLPATRLLKDWRAQHARSQTAIAAALDIKQNTVSEWEKGSRRPDLANALRLEEHTDGGVPATAWGYSANECAAMLQAMVRVARRHDDAAADDLAATGS